MNEIEKVANCIKKCREDSCSDFCTHCRYGVSDDDYNVYHTAAIDLIEMETEYEFTIFGDENPKPDTQMKIMEATESVAAMLIEKNEKYGDSALHPLNIFSKLESSNSLMSRLDDKLARIKNSDELSRDDVMDITGYLVLLLISKGWEGYEGNVEKLE